MIVPLNSPAPESLPVHFLLREKINVLTASASCFTFLLLVLIESYLIPGGTISLFCSGWEIGTDMDSRGWFIVSGFCMRYM